MEDKSLKENLKEISEKLDELTKEKRVKEWKLPFTARTGLGKARKRKGYVLFQNIGLNKAVTFIKAPIVDGVAIVNGIPHVVNPNDILLWKNKTPLVVQPQWSERPFSPEEHHKQTQENGTGTEGWQFIMNYMLNSQIKQKKDFPTKAVVIGLLILVGLGWYLMKSGALS